MIYHCDACLYNFDEEQMPSRCPDCGKPAVREATEEEIQSYIRLKKIVEKESWDTELGFPALGTKEKPVQ